MPNKWDTAKPAILAQEIRAWQSRRDFERGARGTGVSPGRQGR